MTSISALGILGSSVPGSATASAATTPSLTVLGYASQLSSESATGGSGGVFGAIASSTGGNSIQNILNTEKTQQSRTGFFNNVANYLKALQTGQIQPSGTWQTDAAYLQQTGQPFVVTADSKGQVQVQLESQADLSKYTPAQQRILQTALSAVSDMAQKIQANAQNQSWIDSLNNVEPTLLAIHAGDVPPEQGWQTQAASLAATGVPFKVGLDSHGNLTVENQFEGQFPDVPVSEQSTLAKAIGQLQHAFSTGIAANAWEAEAITYAQEGQDYYLDVDQTTGNILVKTNSGGNIVPDFLNTPPYANIGADTPWLQHAASLIQSGTGFYLDIGGNGQIIVRQNDGHGINLFNQPRNTTTQNPIVNLLV